MENLRQIIYSNTNIEGSLIDKIIECIELILTKYPTAYNNLYKNLKNITIRYTDEFDNKRLSGINVDSSYNTLENLLIVNENFMNGPQYKHLLIHELLHVASYNDENLGFENLKAKQGMSFNEGMTEYLTQTILNDYSFGMHLYLKDINNINMLETIIPTEKLSEFYFTVGLKGIFMYLDNVEDIVKLVISSDKEHIERIKTKNFNISNMDDCIKVFMSILSKKNYQSEEEVIYTIITLNRFIFLQYETNIIPPSVKPYWNDCINTMMNNYIMDRNR